MFKKFDVLSPSEEEINYPLIPTPPGHMILFENKNPMFFLKLEQDKLLQKKRESQSENPAAHAHIKSRDKTQPSEQESKINYEISNRFTQLFTIWTQDSDDACPYKAMESDFDIDFKI